MGDKLGKADSLLVLPRRLVGCHPDTGVIHRLTIDEERRITIERRPYKSDNPDGWEHHYQTIEDDAVKHLWLIHKIQYNPCDWPVPVLHPVMKTPQDLVAMAKGNPGAAMFLAQLWKPEYKAEADQIFAFLDNAPTVRGSSIYVLFSDLAGRNIKQVATLCQRCPSHILIDACSRQDYSGQAVVAPYLSTDA